MLASVIVATAAIFHGTPAVNAPWFASLEQGQAFCSGSLIAPDRVLTAAHCVQGASPKDFQAHLAGQARNVKAIYFPPNYRLIPSPVTPDVYSASGSVNDIAIVVLKDGVNAPTLPVATTPPAPGEQTITVGIGTTDAEGGTPDQPLQSVQQVSDCSSLYPPSLLHPSLHLCTQDPTANKSQACPGDSGGAVTVTRDGVQLLAAVVTWGGETLDRQCGEGPADVSERVLAHQQLVTGPLPKAPAPYSKSAVKIDRRGKCHRGSWSPAKRTKFKIRYFKRHGKRACSVTATTAGGWVQKESYNAT